MKLKYCKTNTFDDDEVLESVDRVRHALTEGRDPSTAAGEVHDLMPPPGVAVGAIAPAGTGRPSCRDVPWPAAATESTAWRESGALGMPGIGLNATDELLKSSRQLAS
jgi:hypothetical protein